MTLPFLHFVYVFRGGVRMSLITMQAASLAIKAGVEKGLEIAVKSVIL